MDNGENTITPESVEKQIAQTPESWIPESPDHKTSELGSNAINNSIISSAPEEEPLGEPEKPFDIKDVFPEETKKPNASIPEDGESRLIFNPSDIAPQEEGLSQSAKTAVHGVEDLILRGDDPRDAYVNYQALRKAATVTNMTPGGQEK